MEANRDIDWEERKADRRNLKEMMKMMGASHKEMVAKSNPEMDAETMACQKMEACLVEEERTSLDRKPEAAEQ
jgi:hypothetical protein